MGWAHFVAAFPQFVGPQVAVPSVSPSFLWCQKFPRRFFGLAPRKVVVSVEVTREPTSKLWLVEGESRDWMRAMLTFDAEPNISWGASAVQTQCPFSTILWGVQTIVTQ